MTDTSYDEELAAFKKEHNSGASQIPGQRASTDTSYEEELEQAKKDLAKPRTASSEKQRPPAVPLSEFKGQKLQFATPWKTYETGIPLNPGLARALAQVGSGTADWKQGGKQLINDITGKPVFENADRAAADEKRRFDDPLNRGFMGTVNNLIGKVGPALAIPASAPAALGSYGPLALGAASGALQGAVEPVATGESRGANIGIGAVAGSVIPGTKALLQRAAGMNDPYTNQLAREAVERGIKSFGAVDTAKPGFMTAIRHVAEAIPVAKGFIQKTQEKRDKEFTRAVSKVVGLDTDNLTSKALQDQHDALEKTIQNTWGSKDLVVTRDLRNTLADLRQKASTYEGDVSRPLLARIQNFEDRIVTKTGVDPQTGTRFRYDAVPGEVAHNFQEGWEKGYKDAGVDPHQVVPLFEKLRESVNSTFKSQLPQAEREALDTATTQYKASKAVMPAITKSTVGRGQREAGTVSPQDLSASVENWYGKNAGETPFGQLPQIGQQIMRDTSTKDRTLLSLLPAMGITGVAGGHMGYLANPGSTGIGLGIAGALSGIGSVTGLIGGALSSKGVREALMDNSMTLPSQGIRAIAAQGPLAWREQTQANEELGPLPEEPVETAPEPVPPQGPLNNTANLDVPWL